MNDARFDQVVRMLAKETNRRQFLKSAAGGAFAAGITRAPALAQDLTPGPTQTPGPWVFDPSLAKPSDKAILMPFFAPAPGDWNVEHPERVVFSSYSVHYFDIQSGLTFQALNAQQAAALPSDTSMVGFFTFFQQPSRGGEPHDVGTTLDFNQLYFPAADDQLIAQYWQTYQDTYFPSLDQKNLGIDAIPNANYVTYDVTLADGRQCQVLAGVAQNGPFINHANVTSWDGSKPSASALKRVLGTVDERQRFIDESLNELREHIYRRQRANAIYWEIRNIDWENPAAKPTPEPVLVRPLVIDSQRTAFVHAPSTSDAEPSLDDVLFGAQFSQPYPIQETEHIMIFNATPMIFNSREAAEAWFGSSFDLQDHPPSRAEFAGRSYFDVEGAQSAEDGMTYPAFETVIHDGQTVTTIQIQAGVPVIGTPTDGYRNVLRGIGEAARKYFVELLDNESPESPDAMLLETALVSAIDFQKSCAIDSSVCSSLR
jgi:hypothetical protein